jgi:hypothetical protein
MEFLLKAGAEVAVAKLAETLCREDEFKIKRNSQFAIVLEWRFYVSP